MAVSVDVMAGVRRKHDTGDERSDEVVVGDALCFLSQSSRFVREAESNDAGSFRQPKSPGSM